MEHTFSSSGTDDKYNTNIQIYSDINTIQLCSELELIGGIGNSSASFKRRLSSDLQESWRSLLPAVNPEEQARALLPVFSDLVSSCDLSWQQAQRMLSVEAYDTDIF